MADTVLRITCHDTQWHEAFHRYIARVFPRVSFRRWAQFGGWSEDYCAYALVEGSEIIANASLLRMEVIVDGCAMTGWQLGAVGVVPEHRGRGLQRRIMPQLLASPAAGDLVFLFANPGVVDFYPRFGFRRVANHVFAANCSVAPAAERWTRLNIEQPGHRALLVRCSKESRPVTTLFGARNYGDIALWYWANFYGECFYYSAADDAIAVVEQEGELLRVLDVMSAGPFDLASCLPRVITSPVSRLEFGFMPEHFWPDATPLPASDESPLFVLGSVSLPARPFGFPALAHT